jgi:hypothetical protein
MLLPLAMFSNRTITAALFTIAIATSLIVVSSGSLVGSVLAKKEKQNDGSNMVPTVSLSSGKDTSSPPAVLREDSTKLNGANADDSSGSTGDTSGVPGKDLKTLSNCESSSAEDGDLTQAEVTDCYHQAF